MIRFISEPIEFHLVTCIKNFKYHFYKYGYQTRVRYMVDILMLTVISIQVKALPENCD